MSYGYPFQNMPVMDPMNSGKLPLAPALYVGEIDRHIQEETLYDFFSKFGPIHFVRIMRDANTGQSRGYGFVNFVYPRDADAAKKYGQYEKLGEKHIRIMFKRNIRDLPAESNIYIKHLGNEINIRELDNHFSAIGPVVCCKIASTPDGKCLGYGYVQYENKEDARTALKELQGSKLKETVLDLAEFIPKEKRKNSSKRNLYVKNLPNKPTAELEKIVDSFFSKHGEIEMRIVVKHPTQDKYSAFICYKEEDSAQQCFNDLSKTPTSLEGSTEPLYLNWHQSKAERARELRQTYSQSHSENNLYLKNLRLDITEDEVKQAFQTYGKVISVQVKEWVSPNKEKKANFAFVAFENPEDAKNAQKEAFNNPKVGELYLKDAPRYINIHQSKEKRKEYLNSVHRKYMQILSSAMMPPNFFPYPQRRFQPYPQYPMRPNFTGGFPGARPRYDRTNEKYDRNDRNDRGVNKNTNRRENRNYNTGNNNNNNQKPKENTKKQVDNNKTQKPEVGLGSGSQNVITVSSLKSKMQEFLGLEDEKKRQILGEMLFPKVKIFAPQHAPKITGMLVDLEVLEVSEILELLEDDALLKERIDEALELVGQEA